MAKKTAADKEAVENETIKGGDQPLDETIEGGRYMVGDVLVDANGKPIKE